jgi:hypothetical protein
MKAIHLHRPAADNAGRFVDAGTDLTVGDAAEDGVIDAGRAQELVDGAGAVDATPAEPTTRKSASTKAAD